MMYIAIGIYQVEELEDISEDDIDDKIHKH